MTLFGRIRIDYSGRYSAPKRIRIEYSVHPYYPLASEEGRSRSFCSPIPDDFNYRPNSCLIAGQPSARAFLSDFCRRLGDKNFTYTRKFS